MFSHRKGNQCGPSLLAFLIPLIKFIFLWVTYLISSVNYLGVPNFRTIGCILAICVSLVFKLLS